MSFPEGDRWADEDPLAEYGVELDSEEPELKRGAQFGDLYMMMILLPDQELHQRVHLDNFEMLRRGAESAGRRFEYEMSDETHMAVTIHPKGA